MLFIKFMLKRAFSCARYGLVLFSILVQFFYLPWFDSDDSMDKSRITTTSTTEYKTFM
jgi:hypothetical protein